MALATTVRLSPGLDRDTLPVAVPTLVNLTAWPPDAVLSGTAAAPAGKLSCSACTVAIAGAAAKLLHSI